MKFKFFIFAVKSATRMTQNLILFFFFLMTNNLPRKLHVASTHSKPHRKIFARKQFILHACLDQDLE